MQSTQSKHMQSRHAQQHKELVALLAAFYAPKRRQPLVLWPVAQRAMRTPDGRPLVCGAPAGMADLIGILATPRGGESVGLHVEVEVKTGSSKQSSVQRAHDCIVQQWGGRYLVARSIKDVQIAVCVWLREGLSSALMEVK